MKNYTIFVDYLQGMQYYYVFIGQDIPDLCAHFTRYKDAEEAILNFVEKHPDDSFTLILNNKGINNCVTMNLYDYLVNWGKEVLLKEQEY